MIFDIADAVVRLMAPVLVHTADEAWLALHSLDMKAEATVHELPLPTPSDAHRVGSEAWDDVMDLRDRALKALETARSERELDNPLDTAIAATLPAELFGKLQPFADELADLHGVSRFELKQGEAEAFEIIDLGDEPRCERSWKRDPTVKQRSDGGLLTDRDAQAVGVA
jgi:isoleucyl-tRNA synthetase